MPANCRIIKKPEDLDMVAAALRQSKTISSFLRKFPQVGPAVRLINPAADMSQDDVARHVIAHAVLREERQTAVTAALSLIAKDKPLSEHFDIADDGIVMLSRKTGSKQIPVHINDLLEGKTINRYALTPEQKAALQLRKDIWDDARFDYRRFGGDLADKDDLFPRIADGYIDPVTGKMTKGDEFGVGNRSRYGGSPLSKGGSFTRSRAMNPDGTVKSSHQMSIEGWRYVDPDVALHSKALEIARRTADAQFTQWLTSQPNVLRKRDILGAAAKTGVNPARWGMVGFDTMAAPSLAGYYAPPEVVKYVNDLLSTEKKAVIPGVTWLVNESRGAIASMDFGTTGVQLLNAFGADVGHLIGFVASAGRLSKPSAIFPTAVYNSFKSFFSDSNLVKYYADNKDVIDRWSAQLGGMKNSEYVSTMLREKDKSVVMRVPLMTRFARSFEASLDVAKIEYVKSLERIMGQDISAADKEILGSWVRNSTGMTSTSRMGVSPRQQDIEATWLFFSPRFTRSLFATAATLFKMDKSGHEARLAIGGLMAGATAVYLATAAALGQEPDLEPIKNGRVNPGFFTVRVGENRVGIGGGVRAMSRLTADSYQAAKTDPTRFISPDFKGNEANPFLSFWRSRSAPLTGTVMDIWTGEDYKGTPIEDGNDWARLVAGRTLPFSVQAALEAKGQTQTQAGLALASGFGLNTNPVTSYQLYDEYLKDIRTASGRQRFPEGANTTHSTNNHFKEFVAGDDRAGQLKRAYEESRLEGGSPGRDIQRVLDERKTRLEAADDLLAETGDYRRYRTQVNQIRADSRSAMSSLHLDSIPSKGDKKVVATWYETYNDPRAVDPVTGGIDSEGLEAVQEEWKNENPGDWERLIEPTQSIGETPMESELRGDRKKIADSGWWDTDADAWEQLNELVGSYDNPKVAAEFKLGDYGSYAEYAIGRRQQYIDKFTAAGKPQPQLLADIMMQRDPLATAFNKLRTKARLYLQYNNPELIILLDKWGYNHTSLAEYQMAVAASQNRIPDTGYVQPQ